MRSRIEHVVREVSDLRSFYLRLQKMRRQSLHARVAAVQETQAPFGSASGEVSAIENTKKLS